MKSSEKPPTRPAPEGALDATLPGSSLPDPAVSTARSLPDPAVSTARVPAVSTARAPAPSTTPNPVLSSQGRPVSTARNPDSSSDPDPVVSTSREPDDDIDPALESTIHFTDVPSTRRHDPPPAARVASSAPAGTRISSSDAPTLAQTRESGPTGVGHAFSPGGSSDRPTAFGATVVAGAADDTVRTDAPGAAILLDQELPAERYGAAEALAAGGMGEVAVLGDRWIGREVAKKSMRPEIAGTGHALERFLREIRVQGQLEHPSIVPVYDVGRSDNGELYFTMRRIQGMTMADVLDGLVRGDEQLTARFSRRKLLTAFSSVCMTVHYAHSRGVVHRDLKPSNIMLGEYGEVYVLDWGIAKLVEGGQELSEAGRALGTLGYMAPEQACGREVDTRADVYALGVILFEILAGEHVLKGMRSKQMINALAEGVDARPTLRAGGRDVPPELEAVCVRATARLPEDRFPTAQAMSEAIEGFLDGDRDLTRRRELATGYAVEAEAQADRALARGTPVDEAEAARTAAVRNVLHALALAPEQPEATRTLARLIIEVPDEPPPGIEAERRAARAEERVTGARFAAGGFAAYALSFPLMLVVGIKSWLVVGGGMVLTVVASLLALWVARTRTVGSTWYIALLALNMVLVMTHSAWLGPFVLLPTSACITTSIFALYSFRHERRLVVASGALMFLVPFALEMLHVVPPGFSFEHGAVILHERGLALPPTLTTIGLVYTSVGYILLPSWFLFRVRDALRVAEDRRLLQAWTLKQLFPKGVDPK